MRSVFLYLLILTALSSWTPIDFYVSPNGNDANIGSKEKPFNSLHKAQQAVREQRISKPNENITVWLEDGKYFLKEPLVFSPADAGSTTSLVQYKAIKNAHPLISGGVEIRGWEKTENGIWVAKLPEEIIKKEFRELFINDDRGIRAKHPNNGYMRITKPGADKRTSFQFNAGDFPLPRKATQTELIFLHDWSISRIPVKKIDSANSMLETISPIGAFWAIDNWEEHPRYFLENDIAFLDSVNEWYVDTNAQLVFLKIAEGKNPNEEIITAPIYGPNLIKITGTKENPVKNISFEGLSFKFCSWPLPNLGYAEVQASFFDQRSTNDEKWNAVPAAVDVIWGENCTFSQCNFSHLGGTGISLGMGSRKCSISNSHFEDISGVGIIIGEDQGRKINNEIWWKVSPEEVASNNTIEGSTVTDCGKQFYGAVGIWCGITAGTMIARNHIYHLPYSGISIGWEWTPQPTACRDNHIEGNHIHDIMNILSDGGGVYMLGLQPGSSISNNLIHDVKANAGKAESNGMFIDEGSTDVTVAGNIIYNISKSPIRFHKAKINVVKNNLLSCEKRTPPIRYNVTNETDIQKENNTILKNGKASDNKILQDAIATWMKENTLKVSH